MSPIGGWQGGVYRIRNKGTGKFYIGSATESFKERWANHRSSLRRGVHCNRYLQRSWNKYGVKVFVFEIIERLRSDMCLDREQHYLDTLRPWDPAIGYNASKMACNVMGGRNHTEETKAKMSAKRKGKGKSQEHRDRIKAAHWSKRPDAAEIAERSASKNRGKKRSDEHKTALSEGNRRRWEKYRAEQQELTQLINTEPLKPVKVF